MHRIYLLLGMPLLWVSTYLGVFLFPVAIVTAYGLKNGAYGVVGGFGLLCLGMMLGWRVLVQRKDRRDRRMLQAAVIELSEDQVRCTISKLITENRLQELVRKVKWCLLRTDCGTSAHATYLGGEHRIAVTMQMLWGAASGDPLTRSVLVHELAHVAHRDTSLWGPAYSMKKLRWIMLVMPVVTAVGLLAAGAVTVTALVFAVNVLAFCFVPIVLLSTARVHAECAADAFVAKTGPSMEYLRLLEQAASSSKAGAGLIHARIATYKRSLRN